MVVGSAPSSRLPPEAEADAGSSISEPLEEVVDDESVGVEE